VSEALAEELIAAANGDTRSYAVSKKGRERTYRKGCPLILPYFFGVL